MRNLHAPWRMEYVGSAPEPGCLFCRVRASPPSNDRSALVLHRGEEALVMLNRFPYNSGHLLVAPRAHVGTLEDLDDAQTAHLMRLVRRSLAALRERMAPHGFNIGVNEGAGAGAGIPEHVHVHLVPRWEGDTNFMPVLADVKVVNEHLERTWERLSEAFTG